MSYLRKITHIPWEVLQVQFGASYKDVKQFKRRFIDQLNKITTVYPEARIKTTTRHLTLLPSKSHVIARRTEQPDFMEKPKEGKKCRKEKISDKDKYIDYKHNKIIEIIESQLNENQRHKLFNEFDDLLIKQNLTKIRTKIKKGIHDKEVKEHLFNFIDSTKHHHLLSGVASFDDFLNI